MKLGLVGRDIHYSLSPKIYQFWFHEYKINGEFHLIDVPHFDQGQLIELRDQGFKGLAFTIPYKQDVFHFPLLQKDTVANEVGAINVTRLEKALEGTNTDSLALKNLMEPFCHFSSALIMGGGGAARASLWALRQKGINKVYMTGRTSVRASNLGIPFIPLEKVNQLEADVFVNATPLGRNNELIELPKNCKTVVDWVYKQDPTPLKISCLRQNANYVDGLSLLISQAQYAFYYWTGIWPDKISNLKLL